MSSELLTAIASIGTFVVIAATAIAAVIQLRHMRAANQVAALKAFAEAYEGPELRDAFYFVRTQLRNKLEDPAFRRDLRFDTMLERSKHPEIQICNFFDQWGCNYRDGAIDRRSFLRVNAGVVANFWALLEPVIALMADPRNGNTSFQQFEYLTVQARRWCERNPAGDFPKEEKRIALVDPWRDVDATSRSTAAGRDET